MNYFRYSFDDSEYKEKDLDSVEENDKDQISLNISSTKSDILNSIISFNQNEKIEPSKNNIELNEISLSLDKGQNIVFNNKYLNEGDDQNIIDDFSKEMSIISEEDIDKVS